MLFMNHFLLLFMGESGYCSTVHGGMVYHCQHCTGEACSGLASVCWLLETVKAQCLVVWLKQPLNQLIRNIREQIVPLFSLIDLVTRLYSVPQVQIDISLCSTEFLAVGGGGHFALYLDSDLLNGSSSFWETYGNPCLAFSEDFEVKEIEVCTMPYHLSLHSTTLSLFYLLHEFVFALFVI